jgi:hypothetical protein
MNESAELKGTESPETEPRMRQCDHCPFVRQHPSWDRQDFRKDGKSGKVTPAFILQ